MERRFCSLATLILALLLLSSLAHAQWTPKRGDTGATPGIVKEFSPDWILLQRPDGLAVRYWFKSGTTLPASYQDTRATTANLMVGDRLEIRWSYDDRERIESLALPAAMTRSTALPSPAAASPVSPILPTAESSTPATPAPTTLSERVNGWIDSANAAGQRLLELPVFMLLIGVGIVGGILALIIRRLVRRAKNPRLVQTLLITEAALLILAVAFMIDRKISRLQDALAEMRTKSTAETQALLEAVSKQQPESQRQSFFFDPAAAAKSLTAQIGEATLRPLIYDSATDVVQIHLKNPLIQAYLTIIDLHNPNIEIKLGASLDYKTLTSAFARENDCTIAINGEAGMSPAPGSGLGVWQGYMVRLGQILSRENAGIPRPYLAFDKQNHAQFIPAAIPDRALAPDRYNVIWGRLDALLNGVVQSGDPGNRQPRTAMAISQDGSKLYLLIIDGRQPNYSSGMTRAEVAQTLKAFGAYNGMLCDEGGSSCIYLKQLGGISNIPSDNQGQERPTYTHFGISLHSGS